MSDDNRILDAEECPKCGGTTAEPTVFRGEFVRRDGGRSDDWTCDSEWHGVKALRAALVTAQQLQSDNYALYATAVREREQVRAALVATQAALRDARTELARWSRNESKALARIDRAVSAVPEGDAE